MRCSAPRRNCQTAVLTERKKRTSDDAAVVVSSWHASHRTLLHLLFSVDNVIVDETRSLRVAYVQLLVDLLAVLVVMLQFMRVQITH